MPDPNVRIIATSYTAPSRENEGDNVDATTDYYGKATFALEKDGNQVLWFTYQLRRRKDPNKAEQDREIVMTAYRSYKTPGAVKPFFEGLGGVTNPSLAAALWEDVNRWCKLHNVEFGKAVAPVSKGVNLDLTGFTGVGEKPTQQGKESAAV